VVGRQPLGSAARGEAVVESDYKARASPQVLLCTHVLSDLTADDCCPAPNNEQPNSPSRSDRLGHVYSLMEVSVSRAVLQILNGYRCCVDKAADSTYVLCLLTPCPPGLPTNSSTVAVGGSPPISSPPLIHWELITIQWMTGCTEVTNSNSRTGCKAGGFVY